ncbi:uncharacterized protein TNCV_149061 [Trichonephila clavipes]|nr:uncharacterized protein TNCV_149061 [Trichonephila clavipes]
MPVRVYEDQTLFLKYVYDWFSRFREGPESVSDNPCSERPMTSVSDENIEKRYTTLNCNKTTMYYSIDMNFFSKDNLVALHFKYDQARWRFVEWAQNEIAVVPDFHKRILFSDEAHFWLNGYVNKQNCRIWSEANPQVYVETPLHSRKTDCLVRFMGWWNPSSKTMMATMLQSMVIGIEP